MNGYLKHKIVGVIVPLLILASFKLFIHRELYGWDKGIAFFAIAALALGKEFIWDRLLKKGTFDIRDITSTITAGWITIFLWIIVETIIIRK